MKYNNYILISSWQDIHYGIYLIHIKKFKKIGLIFFEKDLYNFFHKKLNLGKKIKLFFIRIQYINLELRPKNILSILKYPYQIYLLKKKLDLFFFNESIIYTFGNNIAFKNGIFLKHSNFNKIYSYDITKIKEELLKKRNIKNTFFLNEHLADINTSFGMMVMIINILRLKNLRMKNILTQKFLIIIIFHL